MSELLIALVSAVVGGVLSYGPVYLQARLQLKRDALARDAANRVRGVELDRAAAEAVLAALDNVLDAHRRRKVFVEAAASARREARTVATNAKPGPLALERARAIVAEVARRRREATRVFQQAVEELERRSTALQAPTARRWIARLAILLWYIDDPQVVGPHDAPVVHDVRKFVEEMMGVLLRHHGDQPVADSHLPQPTPDLLKRIEAAQDFDDFLNEGASIQEEADRELRQVRVEVSEGEAADSQDEHAEAESKSATQKQTGSTTVD